MNAKTNKCSKARSWTSNASFGIPLPRLQKVKNQGGNKEQKNQRTNEPKKNKERGGGGGRGGRGPTPKQRYNDDMKEHKTRQ